MHVNLLLVIAGYIVRMKTDRTISEQVAAIVREIARKAAKEAAQAALNGNLNYERERENV